MSNPLRGHALSDEMDQKLGTHFQTAQQKQNPFNGDFKLGSLSSPSEADMEPVLSPVDTLYGRNVHTDIAPTTTTTSESTALVQDDEIVWDDLKVKKAQESDRARKLMGNVLNAKKLLQKHRHGRVHSITGAGGDTVMVTSKKVHLPFGPVPGGKVAPLATPEKLSLDSKVGTPNLILMRANKRDIMKTKIKQLQEERADIEGLSKQLTASRPGGVQGMLDACRLTELRQMCIEEERRLTEILLALPKKEAAVSPMPKTEKVSSSLKKNVESPVPKEDEAASSLPKKVEVIPFTVKQASSEKAQSQLSQPIKPASSQNNQKNETSLIKGPSDLNNQYMPMQIPPSTPQRIGSVPIPSTPPIASGTTPPANLQRIGTFPIPSTPPIPPGTTPPAHHQRIGSVQIPSTPPIPPGTTPPAHHKRIKVLSSSQMPPRQPFAMSGSRPPRLHPPRSPPVAKGSQPPRLHPPRPLPMSPRAPPTPRGAKSLAPSLPRPPPPPPL